MFSNENLFKGQTENIFIPRNTLFLTMAAFINNVLVRITGSFSCWNHHSKQTVMDVVNHLHWNSTCRYPSDLTTTLMSAETKGRHEA